MQTSEQTEHGNGDKGSNGEVDGDQGHNARERKETRGDDDGQAGNGGTSVQGSDQGESTEGVEASQPASKQKVHGDDGKIRLGPFIKRVVDIFSARIRREDDPSEMFDLGDVGNGTERLPKRAFGIIFLAFLGELGISVDRLEALRPRDPTDPKEVVDTIFAALAETEFAAGYEPDPQLWRVSDTLRTLSATVLSAYFDELGRMTKFDVVIRGASLSKALAETKLSSLLAMLVHGICLEHSVALTDATREVAARDARDYMVAARYLAGSLGYDGSHESYKKWLSVLAAYFRETELPVVTATSAVNNEGPLSTPAAPPPHAPVAHEPAMQQ